MNRKPTPTGSRRPSFDSLEDRLRWARETAPLTQAELAAHLGISKRTVQNYEAGVGHPSEERLLLWANVCDADYNFLAGDFYTNPGTPTRRVAAASSSRGVSAQSSRGLMSREREYAYAGNTVQDALTNAA